MVQIQRAEKKAVYAHLLEEGVLVHHKDFTTDKHAGTQVENIKVRMLMKSLMDRKYLDLVFNWQYFYYFLNNEGKKYLSEFLGITADIVPATWKSDQNRQYRVENSRNSKPRLPRGPRTDAPQRAGGRGEPRRPRAENLDEKKQAQIEQATQ